MPPGHQALPVLANLHKGDIYAQLAAGLGIGAATAHRYIREAIHVVSILAPTLQKTMDGARRKACLPLDSTLPPAARTTSGNTEATE